MTINVGRIVLATIHRYRTDAKATKIQPSYLLEGQYNNITGYGRASTLR